MQTKKSCSPTPATTEQKKAYKAYKLQWMIDHGYTLENLIDELEKLREEGDPDMSLKTLFNDWEFGYGFGSEIWPCFGEFCECETNIEKPFGIVQWTDEDIKSKLKELGYDPTAENVAIVHTLCENDHHFTDGMIAAGWNAIEQMIYDHQVRLTASDPLKAFDQAMLHGVLIDGKN